MKYSLHVALALVLSLVELSGAENKEKPHLGSIVDIMPPAEWRSSAGAASVPLDPKRDWLRPLYPGNQIRCGKGGRVVVELLLNRTNEIRATEWSDIPNHRVEFERRRVEQWQRSNTVTAGRTRGQSPGRRALLVGINTYEVEAAKVPAHATVASKSSIAGKKNGRSGWTNLDGCLNDVEEMRAILIGRFGFEDRDIFVLTNAFASRTDILGGIRQHLIEPSRMGDVAFFFYAGHGSQVANSLSDEPDKLDESIVPADSALGAPDIRDKELRRLFNAAVARGASFTAIFDSCHSGSITRGFPTGTRKRSLEPDLRDIKDDSDAGPFPSSLGALVISAAAPWQEADEGRDIHNVPHGAFSIVLFDALRSLDPRESVERIFLRAKAGLQTWGRAQEPVFDGGAERLKNNLLGGPSSSLPNKTSVAVLKVRSATDITLQGGLAVGLHHRCELSKLPGSSGGPARVRITAVEGMALARAELIEGTVTNLKAGDLLELTQWAAPNTPILRVSIPPVLPDNPASDRIAGALDELRRSPRCAWIEDPTELPPTHVVAWDGREWALQAGDGKPLALGPTLNARSILDALPVADVGSKRPRLFVSIPPSPALRKAIALGEGTANNAIAVSPSAEDARYVLSGRLKDGRWEHAWVAPGLSTAGLENCTLPPRSDWVASASTTESAVTAGESLTSLAVRLGRVKAWLDYPVPADDGRFPYHLVLSNVVTRELKSDGARLVGGEKYGLRLRAEPARAMDGVAPRYVYVFVLDKLGRSTLLFPSTGGNGDNRVPYAADLAGGSPADFPLKMPVPLQVTDPFGPDTYILLSSDQPLPNPLVLESDGVRTRGTGATDPLSQLLEDWGSGTRGARLPVPKDWSVERLTLHSVKGGP